MSESKWDILVLFYYQTCDVTLCHSMSHNVTEVRGNLEGHARE